VLPARVGAVPGGRPGVALRGEEGTRPRHAVTATFCYHPAAVVFSASAEPGSAQRYSPDSWQYCYSRFASQILRRLPGLCPPPRAYSRDLWLNRFGDTCRIEFEWFSGADHDVVLDRILDPVFGPGAEIELLDGQSVAGCYAGAHYAVKLRCIRQLGTWIALRRAAWERRPDDEDIIRTFGVVQRRFREAVEKQHGYGA